MRNSSGYFVPRLPLSYIFLAIATLWEAAPCAAQVAPSASQLNFGSPYVSQPATQTLTLTNNSNAAVYLSPTTLSGDFSYQSNCPSYAGASLLPFPPGAVCSLQVQFDPTTVGKQMQTLLVNVFSQSQLDSTSLIQQVAVPLTGTGLLPITVSPNPLNFGYVLYGYPSPPLPITITNAGVIPVYLGVCGATPVAPLKLSPGQSCTQALSFSSTVLGPETSTVNVSVWADPYLYQLIGMLPVTLTGIGHSLFVYPASDPGFVQIGTTATIVIGLSNTSPVPVNLKNIGITGANFALAASGNCVGTVARGAGCGIYVTYTPTLAVVNSGTVTITDDDPTSPQIIHLAGTGTAVKVTLQGPAVVPGFSKLLDFGNQYLDIASSPTQAILTNTGPVPLSLKGISSASKDYENKNNCESKLAPGASCTVDVSFNPVADGLRTGILTLTEQDPASPQTINLQGYGMGIARQTVHVHYDYIVASDHTDDPAVVAPGALQRVIKAFAAHNIDLDIDPHHTAIPAAPIIVFDSYPGCEGLPNSVNFSTLRAQYFTPKFPDEHYVIFGEAETGGEFRCAVSLEGAEAELPGTSFVIGARGFVQQALQGGLSTDYVSFAIGSMFMHELGHNLGLSHGGGIGYPYDYEQQSTNNKPNYISVMNYNYNLNGIPQGDALGSTKLRQCSADRDCTDGAACLSASNVVTAKKFCFRLDYSNQLLPTGGNTPGALDESNLNEPAGLGSHNTDLALYSPSCSTTNVSAPSQGPVDWDHNGDFTGRNVVSDVDFRWEEFQTMYNQGRDATCVSAPSTILKGSNDWANLAGPRPDDSRQDDQQTRLSRGPRPAEPELNFETAKLMHLLLPLRPAEVVIGHVCPALSKPVLPYRSGIVKVALLGSDDFDVSQVDSSSLVFHGAKPLSIAKQDVNGDGFPDLVLQFSGSGVQLSKKATRARLAGWLKSSQSFVGEEEIVMADEGVPILAACK